jgi:hypothetical protein
LWGVGVAVVWSAVVALIAFKIVDLIVGLRVSEEVEREGLDINEHGEKAYHMYSFSGILSPRQAGATAPAFFCPSQTNWRCNGTVMGIGYNP